ncbi:MAG: rod shape-determining protein MreD [Shewanellaceae bacterium]|nr:rod shape-determining protein MreD [Shewanellaceae bacterium]
MLQKKSGGMVVWFTVVFSLLLEIMPLPTWIEFFRPSWILIVICYWAMALPHRFGVLTACFLGIMLDILLGAAIGGRGLILAVIVYFTLINYQRLRNFPIWQQALYISIMSVIYYVTLFWIQYVISNAQFKLSLLLPALSNMLIWPWAHWFLRKIRRRFKVK